MTLIFAHLKELFYEICLKHTCIYFFDFQCCYVFLGPYGIYVKLFFVQVIYSVGFISVETVRALYLGDNIELFFDVDTLRALYLGDNDFETFPPEIGRLKNLQIVSYINHVRSLFKWYYE